MNNGTNPASGTCNLQFLLYTNGTWASPYNTMALGVANVPTNGEIVIKGPGSSTETLTITKPMTIQAVGGGRHRQLTNQSKK